jgi:hypothetical protein
VFPQRAIFCNGLQRVFPQPVKPALYFEAFAAPFGYAQSRVSVLPQKRKNCKLNKTKPNRGMPVSSLAGRQRRWGTNSLTR